MIIVGLGNPGKEYNGTRHNVGFLVADQVVESCQGTAWKKERGVLWSTVGRHLVIKPQGYMNTSGSALTSFANYKHLDLTDPDQLVIVHDDLDFPLGDIHQQVNRSAGGHNGVASVIEALGTQNFSRLRIGIGNNRDLHIQAEEYVLQKFSAAEQPTINQAIEQAADLLQKKING